MRLRKHFSSKSGTFRPKNRKVSETGRPGLINRRKILFTARAAFNTAPPTIQWSEPRFVDYLRAFFDSLCHPAKQRELPTVQRTTLEKAVWINVHLYPGVGWYLYPRKPFGQHFLNTDPAFGTKQ